MKTQKPKPERRNGIVSLAPSASQFATTPLHTTFEVSGDSVVATAHFKLKTKGSVFRLDWGDGQVSAGFYSGNGLHHHGLSSSTASGEFKLTHVYGVSDDKKMFTRTVTLRITDANGTQDVAVRIVDLIPRYKIVVHSFFFQPKRFEDSPGEEEDEWVINLIHLERHAPAGKRWEFDFSGTWIGVRPYCQLQGASISHELTERQTKTYLLDFLEIDPIRNDHLFSTRIELTVHDETARIDLFNDHLNLYYTKLVSLVIPLPAYDGPILTDN